MEPRNRPATRRAAPPTTSQAPDGVKFQSIPPVATEPVERAKPSWLKRLGLQRFVRPAVALGALAIMFYAYRAVKSNAYRRTARPAAAVVVLPTPPPATRPPREIMEYAREMPGRIAPLRLEPLPSAPPPTEASRPINSANAVR